METEFVTLNLTAPFRREALNGRNWLVASAVSIVPGVLPGSKGPLYYPPEELARDPGIWNGVPVTVGHPVDEDGDPTSARQPKIMDKWAIGQVFESRFDGVLRNEVWIDEELARNRHPKVLNLILSGKPVEISTGLFTDNFPAPQNSTHNGKAYGHVARNYRPDHLAILVDGVGACSVKDGCGLNVNVNEAGESECADCEDKPDEEKCEKCKASATANQQPKSANTGYFKKIGAGTGKGNLYDAALAGGVALIDAQRAKGKVAKEEALQGQNPPSWVTDEAAWDRAKTAADKGGYDEDTYWAVVAHIYERMGGTQNEIATNRETPDMATREQNIKTLTANCDCWKGKEKVLSNKDAFSDDDLAKLVKNAQEHKDSALVVNAVREQLKIDPKLAVNAMPAFLKERMKSAEEDEGEEEEEEEEEANSKAKPAQNARAWKGLDDWLKDPASAPQEVKELVKNGIKVDRREKRKLVQQLLGNVRDDNKRKLLANRYMAKPLDELEELVSLIPQRADNRREEDDDFVPSYVGAGGGPVFNSDDDEVEAADWDLPVNNFAGGASPRLLERLAKQRSAVPTQQL